MTGHSSAKYRIGVRLGAGGMGEVYKAHDTVLDRPVALKLLPLHLTGDPERLRRFRAEARAASALNHPHILVIHDFGELDGRPFIVTEFIDGETLRDRLGRGPLPIDEALRVALQVADALAAAHAKGIVHRDIKPENLMLRTDGRVKVLDFGLAKLTASDAPDDLTRLGTVVGTPRYMSPEQARGQAIDLRTDIFSLGVVLHEMVAGRPPFDAPDPTSLLLAIVNDPPAPLPASVHAAAPQLTDVLLHALSKDRSRRYADVGAFARDLTTLQKAVDAVLRQPTIETAGARHAVEPQWPASLPTPPTRLIGRERELAAIHRLLEQDDARLIVLTGPGGSGKTRLAIAAAAHAASRYEDGVAFVPLAAVHDASLVPSAIVQALGLKASGDSGLSGIERQLRSRELLLVLDNFEQIVGAGGAIADIVAACPRLRLLVTSRTALRVRGEREVAVPPLTMPPLDRAAAIDDLERNEAITLFVDRARAVRPDFAITRDNVAAVAEICVRLDGLPLALELAAARIRLLTPEGMLSRLSRRLPLLTSGARDAPARQQTLRAAIDWSYQLLEPDERRVFARLAAFDGGFSLDAAEAVCGDGGIVVLDAIDALVLGSLLQRRETLDGSSRFVLLQTVGEFGADRLAESGEEDAIRARHAAYYLVFAEHAAEHSGGDDASVFDRLETDHDNLRAAIDWSIQANDARTALRFGGVLWRFWDRRGFAREGADRLGRVLALDSPAALSPLRAMAAYGGGVLADAIGRYDEARSRFEENLSAARASGDEALIANSLNNLGIISLRRGDCESAGAFFTESLARWRTIGHHQAIALCFNNLGNVARRRHDADAARGWYEQAIDAFTALGDERGVAQTMSLLGDLARECGALDEARRLHSDAYAVFRRHGDQSAAAGALVDLARTARESGDRALALTLLQEAAVVFGDLGDPRGIAGVLDAAVAIAADDHRWERAFVLAGAAVAMREQTGAAQVAADGARTDPRLAPAAASADDRQRWLERGRRLPVEDAITLALES